MKWLQDNPVGMVLAGTGGFFLLLILIMTIVWNLPVSVDFDEAAEAELAASGRAVASADMGELNEYEVINQKPVFNETRLPVIEEDGGSLLDDDIDDTIAVADAPDVRLTGVIITPDMRIASLTPANGAIEPVMAHEGEALTGDFLGWQVGAVNPRHVVLESRDGRTVQLDLEIHDKKITEPPKLAVANNTPTADTPASNPAAATPIPAGDPTARTTGQPVAPPSEEEKLSRAEQIRQRIAERREELRRQQEAGQTSGRRSRATPNDSSSAYQEYMQNKIRNQRKDPSSDDDDDG
jgi:hypothetical protein